MLTMTIGSASKSEDKLPQSHAADALLVRVLRHDVHEMCMFS